MIQQLPLLLVVAIAPLVQQSGERRPAPEPTTPTDLTAGTPSDQEPATLVVYDVHDIVAAEARATSAGAESSRSAFEKDLTTYGTGYAFESQDRSLDEAAAQLRRALLVWLKTTVGWNGSQNRIQVSDSGMLVLQGTAAQHEWTRAFVERQREAVGAFVDIEARWINAPLGTFESMQLDGTVLPDAQSLANFFQVLETTPDVTLEDPLRLVVANRGEGELQEVSQVAYVKEWRLVVVSPGNQEIADPVIDVFHEGEVMKFAPTLLPDGRVGIELELTDAQVERPIETRSMRLSPLHESEVEFSVPIISRRTIEARVSLAPNAAFVIPMIGDDPERETLVVLTARILEIDLVDPWTDALEAPEEPTHRRR